MPAVTAVRLAVAGLLALAPPAAAAGGEAGAPPPVRRGAERIETSVPSLFAGDLRDLPRAPAWRPGDPIREIPRRHNPRPGWTPPPPPPPRLDPLLAVQEAAPEGSPGAFAQPFVHFAGQGFAGTQPPDTVGDVGPAHYVQSVNSGNGAQFAVYRKSDGALLAGPARMGSLGTGTCTAAVGDPVVVYDPLADRWLLAEITFSDHRLCIYVSRTGDPVAGGWFAYQFTAPSLPDYPKYAVGPDAYYLATNEFPQPAVYALDRARMLAGATATAQRFTAPALPGFGFQALTPGDLDGPPPPAGAPGWFVRHRDDEAHDPGANDPTRDFLEVWQLHADFASPGQSTFTGPARVPVAEFDSNLCGLASVSCIPQPGGAIGLDPVAEVVMHRLQYRNFGSQGGHETLLGNFTVDADGADHAGLRWFELRRSGAGPWTLFQEGTYAPDATNRWMGSIAMNGAGDVALGYSVASPSVFPGIRYAGRRASDPPGTLPQGENLLVAGTAANSSSRWGDYAATSVDPADDCTFWLTTEYSPASLWATRIAALRFDGCGSPPPPRTFFTLSPCRVLDTRTAGQGPALASGQVRIAQLHGACGVPPTAAAVAANLTVTAPTGPGFLTLYPGNLAAPLASTINFGAGQTRANNAILPLATDGTGTLAIFPFVLGGGQTDVVIDVAGSFE